MYKVTIKKRVEKTLATLPESIQKKLILLVDDLKNNGPLQPTWPNYSKLGRNKYHCHLTRKYVACWTYEKEELVIEVYYAGSRENAPY